MYKINWDKPYQSTKSSLIIDIGDVRLLLKEKTDFWQLDIGIRVYTKDHTNSMVRPPVNLTRFPKPCDFETAKCLTEEYFDNFLSSIINSTI